jgi:L-asparaginase/Glu-tRNA(Gln) amidotransferase subunit D
MHRDWMRSTPRLPPAYGAGNGPANGRDFLRAMEAATAAGIVIVVVTQCVRGTVQPEAYATGSALLHAGAVPGYDPHHRACSHQAGRAPR